MLFYRMNTRWRFANRRISVLLMPILYIFVFGVLFLLLVYLRESLVSLFIGQNEATSTTALSPAARLRAMFRENELAAARNEFAGIPKKDIANKLFYNRVPKCGSSSLRLLMQRLSKINNYSHVSSTVLDDWFLGSLMQRRDFVREFVSLPATADGAASYDRHLYFVKFEQFNLPAPLYMNLVREPAARFVSQFHFLRHNALRDVESSSVMSTYYELDLLKCLQERSNDDCLLDEGRYFKLGLVGFFCGQELECLQVNSRHALEIAKFNVVKYYQAVGILEDMNSTLRVLEHTLPRYFRGATDEFYRQHRSGIHENELSHGRSSKISTIDPKILQILKTNLSTEFEFYEFLKERLQQQIADLSNADK